MYKLIITTSSLGTRSGGEGRAAEQKVLKKRRATTKKVGALVMILSGACAV